MARTSSSAGGNEGLGDYLRELRHRSSLTMREVQERSNNVVKNSYLSQIETGQVVRPSPEVLWHLAQVYGVDYNDLMVRAGHRVVAPTLPSEADLNGIPLNAIAELDDEDRATVLDLIAFLTSRRKRHT